MALLWLSCPHCRVLFHIDDATAGQQVSCRVCGNAIRIPGASKKSSHWYYTINRQPLGPVSYEQLQRLAQTGELVPDELVWQEGMPQWAPARTVEGLYPSPPPLPQEPPLPVTLPPVREELAIEEDSPEPFIAVVNDEPVEIHAVEPPSAPEDPVAVTPPQEKLLSEEPARAEHAELNRSDMAEEPLPVEPEFQIDLASPGAKPKPAEAPPTVDLVFPTSTKDEQLAIDPNIALAPVEPSLDLGGTEPIEDEWSTGYDVAPWTKSPVREPAATPGTAAAPPATPYPIQGETRPANKDAEPPPEAIPVDAIAAAPLAISVSPGTAVPLAIPVPLTGQRPRREIEQEQRARLRQEYRRHRQAWTSVRRGIGLLNLTMAFWFAVIAGSMVIGTAVAIFSGETMSESQDSDAGSTVMTVQLLVMAIFVDPLSIVGLVHCLRVPDNVGPRPLAIGSIVLTAIAVVLGVICTFVPVLRYAVFAVGFARWLVFLFFLQSVAQYFEAHFLMRSLERLLLLLTGTVGLGVLLWIAMAYLSKTFGRSESDTAAMITMTCGTLCTTLPLVAMLGLSTMRYLRAMRDTVALIEEKLYRGDVVGAE